ncbi:MAG: tripartite tricarboxylate transporter TctB family protein [Nocardioidaceae bacterium]
MLTRLVGVGEVVTYGALTATGVLAAVLGSGYGVITPQGRVGPGMVPTVCGCLLAALGAVLVVRAVRERAQSLSGGEGDRDEKDIFGRTERERVRHLWLVFGLLLAAIYAVSLVGFLAAFGAFVFVVSAWVERRRIISAATITAGACAFIYLVFVLLLRVPLPQGMLGT